MSLKLTHTPGEWDGTYANMVEALLADILKDGDIAIHVNGEARLSTVSAVTDGVVRFADGTMLAVDHIDMIEVP